MGSPRYSLTNLAEGLAAASFLDAAGAALTSATGYTASDLGDGRIARAWRSSNSTDVHTFVVNLGASYSFAEAIVALFAVRPVTSTVRVVSITYDRSNVSAIAGYTGSPVSLTVGTRGVDLLGASYDASSASTPAATFRWVKFVVELSDVSVLDVGEVWISNSYTDLSRSSVASPATLEAPMVENRGESRNVARARIAGEVFAQDFPFDVLSPAERTEVLTLWRSTGCGLDPFVFLPDSASAGEVYVGRLAPSFAWEYDAPNHSGVSLSFVEEGRGL